MFYLLYKHQLNAKPFHFNSFLVWKAQLILLCSHSKGDIFTCEDNMLFSHVKISSFRMKAHLVFHWCLYNNIKIIHSKWQKKSIHYNRKCGHEKLLALELRRRKFSKIASWENILKKIQRIEFGMAVARRLKPSWATVV